MSDLRAILPLTLGAAALRLGARATGDTGLMLAAIGAILTGLRALPTPVRLPDVADVAAVLPPGHAHRAAEIVAAANGIVDVFAGRTDAALWLTPAAGSA